MHLIHLTDCEIRFCVCFGWFYVITHTLCDESDKFRSLILKLHTLFVMRLMGRSELLAIIVEFLFLTSISKVAEFLAVIPLCTLLVLCSTCSLVLVILKAP